MRTSFLDHEGEIRTFAGSGKKVTRGGFEACTWPDDCPTCAARMRFEFKPVTARVCACGVRVTQRDLSGAALLPIKRRKHR